MFIHGFPAANGHDSPLPPVADVRPLPDDHPLLPTLEGRLAAALGGSTRFGPLALCWPATAVHRAEETVSFRTNDVGGYGPVSLDPALDVTRITARFARIPEFARMDELKQARLIPCADVAGEVLLTGPIAMDRWIAFETTVDGHVRWLHEGRWYEVGEDEVARMRAEVADLMARRSDLVLPAWEPHDDERRYRDRVVNVFNRRRPPTSTGVRAADLIGPHDELVHIRHLTGLAAAGHLVNRARAAIRANGLPSSPTRPRSVVLAVAGGRWNAEELFTQSLVDVLRLAEDLPHHAVLEFAEIPT